MKRSYWIATFLLAFGILCALAAVQAAPVLADIIYADISNSGTENGQSWDTAYSHLQSALADAEVGDEIWVAAGTYTPVRSGSPGKRTDSFQMKNGVGIYGGFAGTEAARSQRDWEANETVLSGDILGDDVNLCGGGSWGDVCDEAGPINAGVTKFDSTDANTEEAVYCGIHDIWYIYSPSFTGPVELSLEGSSFEACGFVYSGTGCPPVGSGSEIYMGDGYPLIVNAGEHYLIRVGGANYGEGILTITPNTFNDNCFHVIYNSGEDVLNRTAVLDGFTITGGNADVGGDHRHGGGMFNRYASVTVENCTFKGNRADGAGGGLHNRLSSPTINNCVFSGNSTTGEKLHLSGGGVSNFRASPDITNCIFWLNSGSVGGGAMTNYSNSNPHITNCVFYSNSVKSGGGGMYLSDLGEPSFPTVTNCIFWGDSPDEIYNSSSGTVTVTYSDIQGGYPGAGNNSGTPMFTNPGSGDFHLLPSSPCIDAGTNSAVILPITDFEGEPRIMGDIVDMGVDEATGPGTYRASGPERYYVGFELGFDPASAAEELMDVRLAVTALMADPDQPVRSLASWSAYEPGADTRIVSAIYCGTVVDEVYWDPSTQAPLACTRNMRCDAADCAQGLQGALVQIDTDDPNGPGNTGTVHGVSYYLGKDTTDYWYCVQRDGSVYGYREDVCAFGGTLEGNIIEMVPNQDYWAGAFDDLQDALKVVEAGDEVWVASGTYTPGNSATASFSLVNGVKMYGGFSRHGSPTLSLRHRATFPTILSGEIGDPDAVADNCYHVVSGSGLGPLTLLDGFTVSGGNATGTGAGEDRGGGMYLSNGSPALTGCAFRNNVAEYGGGLYSESSIPLLSNCVFWNNSGSEGGGIYSDNSGPVVTNCSFAGNSADSGSALWLSGSSAAHVTNCILWGNTAAPIGGGTPLVSYSDVQQAGYSGTDGNINTDPLFMDSLRGDLHLIPLSPCINAGTNEAPNLPADDFDGGVRIINGIVDMGADEQYLIYVNNDAGGANNGNSWADAYINLQSALGQAGPGCEIWVASGTYTPVHEGSPGIRSDSFAMKNSVALYGGFTGTETARHQRDCEMNRTTLSGEIGNPDKKTDNCYHVFYHTGNNWLNWSARLDGFVISGGYIDDCGHGKGGGMYNSGSAGMCRPTLANCIFTGNYASSLGGGMYNYWACPLLIDCIFSGNNNEFGGGGVYNSYSSPEVISCTFSANNSDSCGWGGGMYNAYSSPVITDCTFSGNTTSEFCWPGGGGIINYISPATLTSCAFWGNAAYCGGGMTNWYCSPTITNCTFSGNTTYFGGGIYNLDSSPKVTNCIFNGNSAVDYGGGMSNDSSSPTVTNCTFSGNSADYGGGMSNDYSSSPTVTNCILWGDTASSGNEIYTDTGTPVVTYCDIQGGYAGTGNINADPLWLNPGSGDFHLQPISPCIDTGSNAAAAGISEDFEGDNRIIDGNSIPGAVVDMGVDEYGVKVGIYVTLQGENRPAEGWEVPITVGFFEPGADVLSATPVQSFAGTTTMVITSGTRAYFLCPQSVAPGTYDITVDSTTTLMNVKRAVSIQ